MISFDRGVYKKISDYDILRDIVLNPKKIHGFSMTTGKLVA